MGVFFWSYICTLVCLFYDIYTHQIQEQYSNKTTKMRMINLYKLVFYH